jgi:hypothetical protein
MNEAEKLKRLRVFTRLAMDKKNGADSVEAIKAVADVLVQLWYGWKMANRRLELNKELLPQVSGERKQALQLFQTEPILAFMAAAFLDKLDYRVTVDNYQVGVYKEFWETFVYLSLDSKRRRPLEVSIRTNSTYNKLKSCVEDDKFHERLLLMLDNTTPF